MGYKGAKKVYCGGIAVRGIYHYRGHLIVSEESGWRIYREGSSFPAAGIFFPLKCLAIDYIDRRRANESRNPGGAEDQTDL